jgi:hypothetical protein
VKGIYVFTPASGGARTVEQVAAGPFPDVAGYDWIVHWGLLNPGQHTYDWSITDAALAAAHAAGRQSTIAVIPGEGDPAWLIPLCPKVTVKQYNTGKDVTMSVPTDPTFAQWLTLFVAQFGAHYDHDTRLELAQATGLGDQGEMVLPPPVTGDWSDYGVDTDSLLEGWQDIIKAWRLSVSPVSSALAIEEPLGPHASQVLPALLPWLQASHPHVMLQQNGLKETTGTGPGSYHADLLAASSYTTVGWQMFGYGAQNGNLRTALEIGLSAKASYFQIYLEDIIDPANTATLQWLNQQLGLA